MRTVVMVSSVLFLGAAMVCWRLLLLVDAQDRESTLRRSLTVARQAVADIERVSRIPPSALPPGLRDADLLRDIETAVGAAGLAPGAVRDLALDGRADDRAGQSSPGLQRRSGRLVLDSVRMAQLGAVLNSLRARVPPLQIEQLALQRSSLQDDVPAFRVTITFAAFALPPAFQRTSPPIPPT